MLVHNDDRVSAVVLAYSRDKILPDLVAALRNQTRKPDEIIVINQGSNPAIASWLAEQHDLTIITQENRGSAGGFCTGIVNSIQRGHGWTWIFDDDAIPELTALEELVKCPYFKQQQTVFLGSRIVDRHGKTYMSPGGSDSIAWYGTVLEDKCVEAVDACWLGLLVRTEAVYQAGLPIADFFLWDEDREFVSRLVRYGMKQRHAKPLVHPADRLGIHPEITCKAIGRLLLVKSLQDGYLASQFGQALLFATRRALDIASCGLRGLERTAENALATIQKVGRTTKNRMDASNHEHLQGYTGYETP
jgi:glycosyltransferase involved in cell wall biosynthesis